MVHGDIGAAKQLGTGAFNQGSAGNPDAGADMNGALPQTNGGIEKIQYGFGKGGRQRFCPFTADGHGKLIASHARQHPARWNAFIQRFGNGHNEIVTDAVAVDIVDVLEAIQIDKHHAFDVNIATQTHAVQRFNECAAVRQMA